MKRSEIVAATGQRSGSRQEPGEDDPIAAIQDSLANRDKRELSTRETILRAAWRLLRVEGAAGISTRKIAREAGVNQALVHYHFGSLDRLMTEVLDHLTDIVVRRQRARYDTGAKFTDNYYAEMTDLLNTDPRTSGWGKVWLEATAIAVNNPDTIGRKLSPAQPWAREVLEARLLASVEDGAGVSKEDAEGLVALIAALRAQIVLDRLNGSTRGHERAVEILGELLEMSLQGPDRRLTPTTDVGNVPK